VHPAARRDLAAVLTGLRHELGSTVGWVGAGRCLRADVEPVAARRRARRCCRVGVIIADARILVGVRVHEEPGPLRGEPNLLKLWRAQLAS
jgi:hypothetical protein